MKSHPNTALLVISVGIFLGLLVVSLVIELPWQPYRPVLPMLPFLTIFPAIWAGVEITRYVMRMDELQQRLVLEAATFGLANTVLVALALGMFQLSYGNEFNMAWILPVAVLFCGIGFAWARRRYHEE